MSATPRADTAEAPTDETSTCSPPTLRISAKDLGQLALPTFCPRCFWLTRRQRKLPFNIFPGIFSSIDSYSKEVVRAWIQKRGSLPPWLAPVGEANQLIEIRRSDFRAPVEGVLLTGEPDAVVGLRDGSWFVLDYKTARFTAGQDALLPMYRVQLNGYALLAKAAGLNPIRGLALVYFEPPTGGIAPGEAKEYACEHGFNMHFRATMLEVPLDEGEVSELARRARELYALPAAPPGRPGCRDCEALEALWLLSREGGSG